MGSEMCIRDRCTGKKMSELDAEVPFLQENKSCVCDTIDTSGGVYVQGDNGRQKCIASSMKVMIGSRELTFCW